MIKHLNISESTVRRFSCGLLRWYRDKSRPFPWRSTSDPYLIIVAETLLQKTRAEKVAEVFPALLNRYPTLKSLAKASVNDIENTIGVLGIAYRAHRLKALAQVLLEKFDGRIPDNREYLLSLPGIGVYGANAILCFAFNRRVPIVDPTIARVLERVFGFHSERTKATRDKDIWRFSEELMPVRRYRQYNYGLLDFGALICTARNPKHDGCPVAKICLYYLELTGIQD